MMASKREEEPADPAIIPPPAPPDPRADKVLGEMIDKQQSWK
jgi:hypothetical protein